MTSTHAKIPPVLDAAPLLSLLFLNVALAISGNVIDTGWGVGGPGTPDPPLIRFMLSCLELRTLARLLLVLLARLTESLIAVPVGVVPGELEVEKIGATPSLTPERSEMKSEKRNVLALAKIEQLERTIGLDRCGTGCDRRCCRRRCRRRHRSVRRSMPGGSYRRCPFSCSGPW
uniref:Secreted protein n=1 Tax=Anopheles culicifacies TaxID=139723 RepID=A0A182LZ37_9DIPT